MITIFTDTLVHCEDDAATSGISRFVDLMIVVGLVVEEICNYLFGQTLRYVSTLPVRRYLPY